MRAEKNNHRKYLSTEVEITHAWLKYVAHLHRNLLLVVERLMMVLRLRFLGLGLGIGHT